LRDAHAVVTGGGHGIGETIAVHLAKAGASITVMGRDNARLEATASRIRSEFGVHAQAVVCDVTVPESIAAAFTAATTDIGPATILVNNAGEARASATMSTSLDLWQRTLDVNLTGAFLCTQQVLPEMIRAAGGRIVNIASTAGLRGYATLAAYCASKHGLIGLTRSVAAETAQYGISVNAVCPGYTEGGMSDQAVRAIMAVRNVSADEAMGILVRRSPANRLTTQDEVASTVSWLCSSDASAITGQAIAVAGGEVM
jgi:NAD(P)-dependent dehydrogenase (short-subunit alcohol dehydrogenase family)